MKESSYIGLSTKQNTTMLGDGNPNSGTQGSYFRYQYASLKLLQEISDALSGGSGSTPAQRTPLLLRVTGPGALSAGLRSVSVYNAGSATGHFQGQFIKSGEQISYTADEANVLSSMTYDGTGTELVITTLS